LESVDLDVLSVMFFQQWLEATELARWNEAAMALYKLQAIEQGEDFKDLAFHETGPAAANSNSKAA